MNDNSYQLRQMFNAAREYERYRRRRVIREALGWGLVIIVLVIVAVGISL